jgi:hypothetical protein
MLIKRLKKLFKPYDSTVHGEVPADSEETLGTMLANVATPTDLPTVPFWRTAKYSPDCHARRLLGWLIANGWHEEILFPEMLSKYHAMCYEAGWAVRPWNPVACAFTKITTGRKIYRWVYDPSDGQQHRLRVYPPHRSDPDSNGDAVPTIQPVGCGLRQAA